MITTYFYIQAIQSYQSILRFISFLINFHHPKASLVDILYARHENDNIYQEKQTQPIINEFDLCILCDEH